MRRDPDIRSMGHDCSSLLQWVGIVLINDIEPLYIQTYKSFDLSDLSYQITTDTLIPQTRHMNSRSFFLNLIQKQKTKTRILLKALQKILIYFDFHPWDKVHFFSVLFRFVFLNFGERYLHNVWILQKIN